MPASSHEQLYAGTQLRVVAPSDSTDLALNGVYPRAIYVGGAGNLAVVSVDDEAAVTLNGIATGVAHAIAAKKIMATGTTATGIVAVY